MIFKNKKNLSRFHVSFDWNIFDVFFLQQFLPDSFMFTSPIIINKILLDNWFMTHIVLSKHKARSIIHIVESWKQSSASILLINTAMDGQWQSSRIVSVRTNRILKKH